jgi:hypothetical protein
MQRLLIAAVSAAFLASIAAPVLADDYPPCTDRGQDHCRVVAHVWGGHHHHHHHHGHDPIMQPMGHK